MFGHGDLKFVVLNLLAEKPRHGYEIIRELEDRFGGAYSPSPGTVYPTLSLLEDLGYARATQEEGSTRKVYEITDEGRRYLDENRGIVDDIFSRVDDMGSFMFGPAMAVLGRAFGNLGRAGFRAAMRHQGDEQWVQRAKEILERAARDIEGLN
ncbi:PadR family transcriptional regulator [Longimicrobium sp.]|uniref:PadR family transcriptional regulator n=1 Tax=Longimicrobium sp. TaxID=2029185 RepID=UPI003B3A410F